MPTALGRLSLPKRGLAGLTRPQQCHGRHFGKGRIECGDESARNHPCNHGVELHDYKDKVLPDLPAQYRGNPKLTAQYRGNPQING